MEDSLKVNRDRILSQYFPGPFESDVTVDCPYDKDCGKTCTFDEIGMYSCSSCKRSGFSAMDYIRAFEGISEENIANHILALLSDKTSAKSRIPSREDCEKMSLDLLSGKQEVIRKMLEKERGITSKVIQDYLIGINARNELVIPMLNATGYDTVGAWFMDTKDGTIGKRIRSAGGVLVYGYHGLRNSPPKSLIVCTQDLLDTVVLKHYGINAIGLPYGKDSWTPELIRLFYDKDVVLCFSDSDEDDAVASQILIDTLEIAQSIKKVVFTTGLVKKRLTRLSDYFVHHKKTAKDFLASIRQLRSVPRASRYLLTQLQKDKENKIVIQKIRPAQDYVDNKLFFAVTIDGVQHLLDSSGQALTKESLDGAGYQLETIDMPDSRFTTKGIGDFVLKAQRADVSSVYEAIRDHLKKYAFIKNDDVYTVLSLWIMGTYMFRAFRHYPYLHISAEKESGKSHLMELMSRLAFNGRMLVEPSKSSLFREIDLNLSSLFLDEVEGLKTKNKASHTALMSVLNSGYGKTGSISVVESGKPRKFSTYSPKMFAGIEDISDTLSSRSIKIRMLRKRSDEPIERYRETKAMQAFEADIRDDLYIFALNSIQDVVEKYESDIDLLQYLSKLENRVLDRWAPILILADIVDSSKGTKTTEVMESALQYLNEDIYLHSIADADESEVVKVVEKLRDLLNSETPDKVENEKRIYRNDRVMKFFQADKAFKNITTTNGLTKLLGKYDIKVNAVKVNDGKKKKTHKCYVIGTDTVFDLGVRYRVWTSKEAKLPPFSKKL